MTVSYINNNAVIVIESQGFKYVVTNMIVNFTSGIRIEGVKYYVAADVNKEYEDSQFTLMVTNNTYRKLSDLTVHTAETALNEEGTLKEGYLGEFDLFVQIFGHNSQGSVNAIYPFIVDAIQRKYSLV